MRRNTTAAIICVILSLLLHEFEGHAFPLSGEQTVLPRGTELNEEALERPREVFRSEAIGGEKSYMVNLGDLLFNSNGILGGPARRTGISCGTCHVNGAGNGKFYIPGMSLRKGTFDTTSYLFNPKMHNRVRDAVRIPSLRGTRYLAPYGNDGRAASLRDFVHDVIVNEFDGPEPSPTILNALVSYLNEIDFLPNQNLATSGRLGARATEAQLRGEALFFRSFPHSPELSCAGCHVPSRGFLDHQQHNIGTGGLFKTPTLMNANFNAPYFHDGRFDTYDEVISFFDRTFSLDLAPHERADLLAYLRAIGDGFLPYVPDSIPARIAEIHDFASVLQIAIPAGDNEVIALAVDTVGVELRDLAAQFPGIKDTTVKGGLTERLNARRELRNLVLTARRIGMLAAEGRFQEAAAARDEVDITLTAIGSLTLQSAQPWSLFNPTVHDAHYAGLRQMLETARNSSALNPLGNSSGALIPESPARRDRF